MKMDKQLRLPESQKAIVLGLIPHPLGMIAALWACLSDLGVRS